MLNIGDVVGITFKGFFQRRADMIEKSKEQRKKLKKEHSENLILYDAQTGSSDEKDAISDRNYNFEITILEYNPVSGFFVAKGKDFFGDSGLVGEIKRGEIKFRKIYAGKNPSEWSRFLEINYFGRIEKPDNVITIGGSYEPSNSNENYYGTWRLDSIPKK